MMNTHQRVPALLALVMSILGANPDRYYRSNLIRLFFAGIVLALSVAPLSIATATQAAMQPELPRVFLNTTYAPPTGRTITVNAGDDFQAALNSAAPSDVITLQAGATFIGNFVLPNKSGSGWIVIRSSAPDSSLPPPGTRLTPASASALPKIVTPNSQPALKALDGAHHFRLIGLEFTVAAGVQQTFSLIELGDNQTSLSQLPHDLILDRVYIHGNTAVNLRRGVTLNSASTAVIDSYISDCHEVGADSQAIGGWNGAGPFKIVNNYLEGAGENVIFGGADPAIPNLVPSDIEFRRNHCFKPLSWRIGDPSYAGTPWGVKNLFELKNAQRVLVDGNIFEHNWAHAQNGFAILFTVRNQDGAAPWSVVQDVTFVNNIVRHSTNGINMHGSDNNYPSQPTRRLLVQNNLFDDIGAFGDGSTMFQVGGSSTLPPAVSVIFNHNTGVHHDGAIQSGLALSLGDTGKVAQGFIFTNNLVTRAPFGVKGSGTDEGKAALDTFLDGYTFNKNVVIDNPAYPYGSLPASSYPTGNFFSASPSAVGFTSYNGGNGGNYRLATTSPYKNAGTDGKDIGCDFDALNAAGSGGPVTVPEADLRIAKTNGVSSVNAGGTTTYMIVVTNNGPGAANNAVFSDPAATGLSVRGVMCGSESGGAACPAPASVTVAAMQGAGIAIPTLPSGGSVTFTVTATVTAASGSVANLATITPPTGVTDPTPGNNTSSDTDPVNPQGGGSVTVPAAGPGQSYPPKSEASDDKAGSLLIYNLYSSNAAFPEADNTRINLTNTNPYTGVVVHLFFVDGSTCSVADTFVCLLPSQTVTFTTAEVDPGTSGYIVAVAVDGPKGFAGGTNTGRPVSFNYLIGDEFIKFSAVLYQANLRAVAFAVVDNYGRPVDPKYDPNSPTAELIFDGAPGNYNRAPQSLAVSNFPSPASGFVGEYFTHLVINRVGGDLTSSAARIGSIFGLLYDDLERALSFTFTSAQCQFRSTITASFPRTTPRPHLFIPDGHSGWMKLFSQNPEVALVGSVIIGTNDRTFPSGGRNMHHLTLAKSAVYTIPVFPPNC